MSVMKPANKLRRVDTASAVLVTLLLFIFPYILCDSVEIDANGYVLYCPCMGRFGNQADQFLGSLAFARGLNRTLVLPPWVEYDYRKPKSIQVPFDKYFKVEPLLEYHRVLTMEKFMSDLAPTIWPPGKRSVFCYSARRFGNSPGDGGCNAKDGNPFGPFWDTFNVDFDKSEFYEPLSFDTNSNEFVAKMWDERFPKESHLILAFTGPPGGFPVSKENTVLHRYLQWSDDIQLQVKEFIGKFIPSGRFLGVHLRLDSDWLNVCEHVKEETRGTHLFASAQCLGYRFEYGSKVTEQICRPSEKVIVKQIKRAVDKMSATVVFVATDKDTITEKIQKAIGKKVKVVKHLPSNPHVDLAILGQADHYIGNCVSTFSAFAARERRAAGKSVDFWAFENKSRNGDEL